MGKCPKLAKNRKQFNLCWESATNECSENTDIWLKFKGFCYVSSCLFKYKLDDEHFGKKVSLNIGFKNKIKTCYVWLFELNLE